MTHSGAPDRSARVYHAGRWWAVPRAVREGVWGLRKQGRPVDLRLMLLLAERMERELAAISRFAGQRHRRRVAAR